MNGKKYNPHLVIVWTASGKVLAAQEFPYKEDAETSYHTQVEAHVDRVVLAKLVKAHGEG